MERCCELCGATFQGRKDKRFCNRYCKVRAKDKRLGRSHVKYRQYKGDTCTRCGFVPEHRCQLDVHHINGNHQDNRPENLTTLCANCHRLHHKPE